MNDNDYERIRRMMENLAAANPDIFHMAPPLSAFSLEQISEGRERIFAVARQILELRLSRPYRTDPSKLNLN